DAVCGAPYGMPDPGRVNVRNGYRHRDFDTRAGTLDVAIPKLRSGSYFPDWLLERRRRADAALTSVVATCYLLGVSTRRMEKLVEALGITRLSKSQVSEMAKDLDGQVEAFRTRPLDAGPYTFVAADALVLKVCEGGRIVNVHALLATGVNAEGYREILGLHVTTGEDGAGWLAFFRDLAARGLSGVALVTSDAHRGLTEAIGVTLPSASWQRCRTHWSRKDSTCCFSLPVSLSWYGHIERGPWAARLAVQSAVSTSERAAAAAGAGAGGPAARPRRGACGGAGGRGQRDYSPGRGVRVGGRRGSAAGRPGSQARRGTASRRGSGSGSGARAAGAGRTGRAWRPDVAAAVDHQVAAQPRRGVNPPGLSGLRADGGQAAARAGLQPAGQHQDAGGQAAS